MEQDKPLTIAGQAVVEGVMMRSKHWMATAVRKPNGKISVKKERYTSILNKHPWLNIPLIRGIFVLIETSIVGMRLLGYSANESVGKKEEAITKKEFAITITVSVLLALIIFKFLPLLSAQLISNKFPLDTVWYALIEGGIKLAIFIIYLGAIGYMDDVQRLFMYHGAEHKSVNCYEAGKKLTVANIKTFTKAQARCGTTFLFLVILLSIIVYMFVPLGLGLLNSYLIRVLLLPFIAGISYEIIKLGAKYQNNPIFHFFVMPGLLLQKLSTNEPDSKQTEVGIKALKTVLEAEGINDA